MIKGVHTMFYSSEPQALREFIREKLRFPHADVGDGWLLFELPEADMGCHPAEDPQGPAPGAHYLSFYCDDIEQTVDELRSRGVEFVDEITDKGYGLAIRFKMPGGIEVELYQPRYERNYSRD